MPDILQRHVLSEIYVSTRFQRVCDEFALHNLSDLMAFTLPSRRTQTWHKALVSIPNFGPSSLTQLINAIHDYGFEHPDILPSLLEAEFYSVPPYKTREDAQFARRETQAIMMKLSSRKRTVEN